MARALKEKWWSLSQQSSALYGQIRDIEENPRGVSDTGRVFILKTRPVFLILRTSLFVPRERIELS